MQKLHSSCCPLSKSECRKVPSVQCCEHILPSQLGGLHQFQTMQQSNYQSNSSSNTLQQPLLGLTSVPAMQQPMARLHKFLTWWQLLLRLVGRSSANSRFGSSCSSLKTRELLLNEDAALCALARTCINSLLGLRSCGCFARTASTLSTQPSYARALSW